MTGFTLIIDHQRGKLNLDSQMTESEEGSSEMERSILGCIQTAVQACVQELIRAYESKTVVTYDDHSQKAGEVFRRCLDEWLRKNATNN